MFLYTTKCYSCNVALQCSVTHTQRIRLSWRNLTFVMVCGRILNSDKKNICFTTELLVTRAVVGGLKKSLVSSIQIREPQHRVIDSLDYTTTARSSSLFVCVK